MSELTFETYARALTEASSLLQDDAIMGFLAMRKIQPIMRYIYRIAAYCVQDLRTSGKMPYGIDDCDYIDAVQECIIHAPQIVEGWAKDPTHKFTTYISSACKRIASNYLWELVKGGTDYGQGKAPPVEQWPELDETERDMLADDFDIDNGGYEGDLPYPNAPQGYRDPMDELMAAEDEDRALRALMKPCATPQETRLRNSRVWRTLRLKGVQHD